MAKHDPDRDLLYGILAVQNGFIDRSTLVDALRGRTVGKAEPLGRVLRDRGSLDPGDERLLDGLVTRHLGRHGDDPRRSLAELDPSGSVRQMLDLIAETRSTDSPPAETRDDQETAGVGCPGASRAVGRPGGSGPRFRIIRPHARGGLGEVHLALDGELNRIVALKTLRARHADDPRSQMRFLIEGEITGGLEHPGIVPVYGLGFDDDDRPYYAMRFVRGDSLKDAIRRFHEESRSLGHDPSRRSLELRQLLGRFVDVCDAMAYAHSRGVLHRDIKPANIMLGPFGETLIVDWGLAKASGRAEETDPPPDGAAPAPDDSETVLRPRSGSEPVETAAGSVCGTPEFMSPEQASGRPDRLGPASDVYSLGATLYCLLTGRPPFQERDVSALLAKVARGEFSPPRAVRPDVPAPLEAICLKAMTTAPEARYQTPRLLAQDIERWLADEPVSALREPWTERARRWGRRHRSLVTGCAATFLVALLALGGILALEAQSNRRLRLANAREARAREQAQARFRLARDAVAGYYRGVSEDVLLRRTEFRDLRRSLLTSAQDFYRKLAAILEVDQEVEPTARLDLARAEVALARITGDIASTGDALKAAYQARALFARLVAERPEDPGLRRELAGTLTLISFFFEDTGQPGQALEALRQGLAIRQELVQTPHATPDDRRALAGTHGNIGNRLADIGRQSEALLSYQEALTIFETLAAGHPEQVGSASDLARILSNIGEVLANTGRLDEALEAAERSHAVRKRLAEAHPRDEALQGDLAGSSTNLGGLRADLGRLAEAMESHQQAAAINRRLVAANPNAHKLRRHLANNYNNIGLIHAEAHRPEEALRAFRQACEIQEALVNANPDDLQYPNELATSLGNIGLIHAEADRADEALPWFERSLTLRSRVAAANPDDVDARSKLAWTHHSIGALHTDSGRPAEAIRPLEQARAIRQVLVDAHPDLTRLRADLAHSFQSLGQVHSELGRADEALRWLQQARGLQEALAGIEAGVAWHRQELARTIIRMGLAYRRADRLTEALKAGDQARVLLGNLVRDHPEDNEVRSLMGQSWNGSGAALAGLERSDEAVGAYREALAHDRAALRRAPHVHRFRRELSAALGNLSEALLVLRRPAEAAASAREIRELWPRDAGELARADRLLSSCATLVESGQAQGPSQGPGQAGRVVYLDAAMDALRQAVDAGFRDPRVLSEDPAFAPLRPRADFRGIVMDLHFPSDPFR
jgi:serine/threonine-protein kinase